MKRDHLNYFRSLDADSFTALMRHLGFPAAAIYQLSADAAVRVLASEATGVSWPAAFALHDRDFSASDEGEITCGWCKPQAELLQRISWPRSIGFYLPDQDVCAIKLLFTVVPASGKRLRLGEMHAMLEAAANRVRTFLFDTQERLRLSDAGIREQLKTLGGDLRMLIDHELRTPLASVAGYSDLLREPDVDRDAGQRQEYLSIIQKQTTNALHMLDKLSLSLYADEASAGEARDTLDVYVELQRITAELKQQASEFIGQDAAARTSFRILKSTDQLTLVQMHRQQFQWAMWEVLKNAVTHSRSGQVDIALYTSDQMLVIDIQDDGQGVAPGADELIFLRFYQEPGSLTSRKGRRGLGLGLFLARHIAERHLGRLSFIRTKGRVGLFRFLWPRVVEADKVKHADTAA